MISAIVTAHAISAFAGIVHGSTRKGWQWTIANEPDLVARS